ncbi:hypothetical protein [Enterococcus phage PEF1]
MKTVLLDLSKVLRLKTGTTYPYSPVVETLHFP